MRKICIVNKMKNKHHLYINIIRIMRAIVWVIGLAFSQPFFYLEMDISCGRVTYLSHF